MPRPCHYYSLYTFDAAAICEAYGQLKNFCETFQLYVLPIEKTENNTREKKKKEKIVGYCADADWYKKIATTTTTIQKPFFCSKDSNIVHWKESIMDTL